jgi:3-hydroxyacyl-CoA dehydrogenase/enoyl-CoA hydratase/3-hydroxybutyryl-CoA epimerase
VGADIGLIQSVTDPAHGRALAAQGQEIYDLLEDLPCTTVAAISGPCVGGGCEMVLACKYRIVAEHPASSIGLPETKLGILPGFGGTYRLPRVVGLPKALDVILAGKTLRPQQAIKAGLVDEVTSVSDLVKRAEEIARGSRLPVKKKLSLMDKVLTWTAPGRALVRKQASASVQKQTKGCYPAPPRALDVTISGMARARASALSVEAEELGTLITTPESKALVHLYYLTEAAKAIGKAKKSEVEKIPGLVVGAGIMGAGIAGSLARAGHQVIVRDTGEAALERSESSAISRPSSAPL